LDVAERAFSEISRVLTRFCGEYQVAEGDFPFSPTTNNRVAIDGSQEQIVPDLFVLTFDIVGSTDSQPTNEFKDVIIASLNQFQQKGFYYEVTGNDAYVVACHDPAPLWDVAEVIRNQGERIRRPGDLLDGTRKGLSYGSLRILTTANGTVRIMDATYPNLLPQAFSMLDGVDDACRTNPSQKNSILLVADSAITRFREDFHLPLKELRRISVAAKHFYGRCVVIDFSA
jgi:hypothetical protein